MMSANLSLQNVEDKNVRATVKRKITSQKENKSTLVEKKFIAVTMLAEIKNKKALTKKVCSETFFQREQDLKKNSQKQELVLPALKLFDKKCSKSLNDLTRQVNYELFSSLSRNDSFLSPERDKYRNYSAISADGLNNNKVAGRCILSLFMLNAWRRQKMDYKATLEKVENLSNKVEDFEMQVYVLRQLLNAEKKRVEAANENNYALLQKIEDCNKEKNLIIKENENVERNFTKLLEYCSQIENAFKNQENDIITSRLEAENWEKQLEKEREKLKKMEREEIFLKEKIQFNEKVLILKNQQIEQLTQDNKELQQKLAVQIPLWDETMAQVDIANAKLKESEEIKIELEKALEELEKEKKELKSTIIMLENRLQKEDQKNGLLGKSILEKSNELSLIQKKLLELSKSSPWSGGIIKVASFCVKIPVACICTVGSLLLPLPSYRL